MKNWSFKSIESIASFFTDGNWIESKDQSPSGIRLIQTGNIGNGFFKPKNSNKRFISDVTFKKLNCTEIFPNDILVSRLPDPVGRACIIPNIDERMITAVDCSIVRTNENVLPEFLNYYFQSPTYFKNVEANITGTTRNRISRKNLGKIEIPIPSLSEQQQIVEKLDSAFDLIDRAKANIEKNIQNAKELFQSKLNQVFSEKGEGENFELKKLSELGTITSSKRIYKSEYVSEGVPFYRTKELKELAQDKEISLELYITKARYDEIKNRFGVPQVGDILLSAVGTIGEILVIENENEFYFKDGNIVWFKDFQIVNPYYLKYLLITFVENIKNMAQGAAYSALTIEKINEYQVYFPKDLQVQQKIVEQLDTLSVQTKLLQQKYQQKLANLEELKKSILEKAFKGELV